MTARRDALDALAGSLELTGVAILLLAVWTAVAAAPPRVTATLAVAGFLALVLALAGRHR